MKRWPIPILLAALVAGCTASGENDPFAYTKKPLYAGGFDLAKIAGSPLTDEFRVTDGSIAAIRVHVWVNATAGGGSVTLRDPSGDAVLTTAETTERTFPLELGVWSVTASAEEGSAGTVHVLATRT